MVNPEVAKHNGIIILFLLEIFERAEQRTKLNRKVYFTSTSILGPDTRENLSTSDLISL